MLNASKNRVVGATLLAAVMAMILGACSTNGLGTSAPEAAGSSTSPSKEAGLVTKDVVLCFTNMSVADVAIKWKHVSSFEQEGTLTSGQTFCGEGNAPTAILTYSDGSTLGIDGNNPAIGQPSVYVNSTTETRKVCDADGSCGYVPVDLASGRFTEGESKNFDVERHQFTVTREANTEWVNFAITIKG